LLLIVKFHVIQQGSLAHKHLAANLADKPLLSVNTSPVQRQAALGQEGRITKFTQEHLPFLWECLLFFVKDTEGPENTLFVGGPVSNGSVFTLVPRGDGCSEDSQPCLRWAWNLVAPGMNKNNQLCISVL
jgi:hypothetical protein